jgi:8-amino-7-oxononanoate synthase
MKTADRQAKTTKPIFQKCVDFTRPQQVQAMGVYPYFRQISSASDHSVLIDGRQQIMIGSNNYLGLTTDPRVKKAATDAVAKYGSGCTGSRFLNGTLDIHVRLEEELAEFLNKEAALVFSTGFQSNLGTISCLIEKGETILIDRSVHASIVDGTRLSFGKTYKFGHNDMDDLARVLRQQSNGNGQFIIVDGVFSMEGDIANLPGIVEIAEEFAAGVMVDDAHAVGVLGPGGRGTAEHFGLEDRVDIIMGTFSKSFASLGGYIAASKEIINYVKHISRELIFSASMPPAAVAAVRAALEIIKTEPERRERLWEITHRMHRGFKELGFNIGTTETPVVPIFIGEDLDCFRFWKALTFEGIFANPIISPAVPPGGALIRTSYTATHTDEELDKVLEAFQKVGRQLGVI